MEVERAVKNVNRYRTALLESPAKELESMMNALAGGYTQPSPGGDPIANPNTLPTGRNLYAINAEATPSEAAWEKGIRLANNTIEMYKSRPPRLHPAQGELYVMEQRIHRDRRSHRGTNPVHAGRRTHPRCFRACKRHPADSVKRIGPSAHRCGSADQRTIARLSGIPPLLD